MTFHSEEETCDQCGEVFMRPHGGSLLCPPCRRRRRNERQRQQATAPRQAGPHGRLQRLAAWAEEVVLYAMEVASTNGHLSTEADVLHEVIESMHQACASAHRAMPEVAIAELARHVEEVRRACDKMWKCRRRAQAREVR